MFRYGLALGLGLLCSPGLASPCGSTPEETVFLQDAALAVSTLAPAPAVPDTMEYMDGFVNQRRATQIERRHRLDDFRAQRELDARSAVQERLLLSRALVSPIVAEPFAVAGTPEMNPES
ncbi:MAG: hypothetical protein AAFQ82_24280 [Myxococcota bacterium]